MPTARLASLDAFRGFTIAAMLLVNNPGDRAHVYRQLEHAGWHGWTFADWIFPFFLFISGVALALASAPLRRVYRRAAVIFALGLLLNLYPHFDFATVRIPGVLQRIALCSALAAPLALYCSWRQLLAWIAGLLAAYSAAMLWIPVPDANGVLAAGVLEPGRDFASWLDRQLLAGHLWQAARTWDPEGLFSTLPALCSQLIGVLAGRWLLAHCKGGGGEDGQARRHGAAGLALAGLLLLPAGLALDAFLMPINKCLWTASYCLFTAGWALLLLAACHRLLDARPSAAARRAGRWFSIYGVNALFIFVLAGLAARTLVYTSVDGRPLAAMLYAPMAALPLAPELASLAYALLFNCAMFAVAWAMWRKGWRVKV